MLKPTPKSFFAIAVLALAVVVFAAILPGKCYAQNSAGDPNRPPYAQTSRRIPQPAAFTGMTNSSAAAASSSSAAPLGDEKILFDHVNEARVLSGLPALHWDASLAVAARQHCALLVQHEALSHQFPGEEDVKERARHAGAAFSVVAENVALAPTADEIHDEWMHSPPHRANILDPELTAIGIAVMPGHKGLYAAQDFSRAVENLTLLEQEEKIRALISFAAVRTADNPEHTRWNEARKACQAPNRNAGVSTTFIKFEAVDLSQLPERLNSMLASGKYRSAAVGACDPGDGANGFTRYRIAVLLY